MLCINFNGTLLPANSPIITAANRGLRYGDGIFETMKWSEDRIAYADDHFERLFRGLSVLRFDTPPHFSPEFFTGEIIKLLEKQKLASARLRLTVIRGEGSLTHSNNGETLFIIEVSALRVETENSGKGKRLCIYTEARKTADILSPLKHNNYLPYCMGAMFAKANGYDDALLLNQFDRVCDSTIANIFLIHDNRIYTPALSEGCVAGIIRKNLIKLLPHLGFEIMETKVDQVLIEKAEAAFLTNSIINIKAVECINEKTFTVQPVMYLIKVIKQNIRLFC